MLNKTSSRSGLQQYLSIAQRATVFPAVIHLYYFLNDGAFSQLPYLAFNSLTFIGPYNTPAPKLKRICTDSRKVSNIYQMTKPQMDKMKVVILFIQ